MEATSCGIPPSVFILHRTPGRLGKAERCQEKGKNRKIVKNIKDVCSLPPFPPRKNTTKIPTDDIHCCSTLDSGGGACGGREERQSEMHFGVGGGS